MMIDCLDSPRQKQFANSAVRNAHLKKCVYAKPDELFS